MSHPQTYFHEKAKGDYEVFLLGECENCGGITREKAKAVWLDPAHRLKRLSFLPPESYYSDQTECEVCENCDPENPTEENYLSNKKELFSAIDLRLKALGLSESKRRFLRYMVEYLLKENLDG